MPILSLKHSDTTTVVLRAVPHGPSLLADNDGPHGVALIQLI